MGVKNLKAYAVRAAEGKTIEARENVRRIGSASRWAGVLEGESRSQ